MGRKRECRASQRDAGFTLVELLVVIVIMGVLSGTVVFAVGKLTSNSGDTACAADAKTITVAEEAYKAQHGQYASEATLATGGQLHDESTLHDVTLSGSNYSLVSLGDCVGSTSDDASGGAATQVSVELLSSGGTPLAGAQIDYLDGSSWTSVGSTGTDGQAAADIPDGTYQFRADYRGATHAFPATAVHAGAIVELHTVAATVQLTGSGNRSGAVITHRGSDGFWFTDDTTDGSGTSFLELLPGSYTFRADFNGETNLSDDTALPGAATIPFPVTTVTVHVGEAAAAVEHRANNGEWIDDGTTNGAGTVTFAALEGNYTVRAHLADASVPQAGVAVSGASTSVNVP